VIDPLQVFTEILLHLKGDSLPERVLLFQLLLGFHLFGNASNALLGIRTPGSAPEIQLGVGHRMAAAASPMRFIFKKFDRTAALRTLGIKDVPRLPIPHILTRTFHFRPPLDKA
jgi:hypothetical protein